MLMVTMNRRKNLSLAEQRVRRGFSEEKQWEKEGNEKKLAQRKEEGHGHLAAKKTSQYSGRLVPLRKGELSAIGERDVRSKMEARRVRRIAL